MKEEDVWKCSRPNEAGESNCKRFIKDQKTGEVVDSGEEANIFIDPNSCDKRIVDMTLSEESMKKLSKIANGMTEGCKLDKSKRGLA